MASKCFVIGPMTGHHGQVLQWLAHDVVQKLLPDWTVTTPDSGVLGNIMNDVVRSCDRADLVIANTTGSNPNVLYEIGLLDALGLQHELLPTRAEDRLEHLFLRAEVVVEQTVRDAGLLGDVPDARAVESVARKDANSRRKELPTPLAGSVGHGLLGHASSIRRAARLRFVRAPKRP